VDEEDFAMGKPGLLLTTVLVLVGGDLTHARTPPQHAGPERTQTPNAPEGPPAAPPEGFLVLCERDPAECRESGEEDGRDDDAIRKEASTVEWRDAFGGPAAAAFPPGATAVPPAGAPPVHLPSPAGSAALTASGALVMTAERWALVDRVNQSVNRAVQMESDQAQYGKADYWNVQSGRDEHGDCEDYALTKRHQLIAAGVPPEVLSFGIVRTPWNELHAVLILTTDQGDMILDNLSAWVLHWDQTGYRWVERQTPGQPFDWRTVEAS
jgi:predicted transglutaminase-like cysteine proteinase